MKKKLVFLISSLDGGGAEKVLVDIVTQLDQNKYSIHLILFEKKGVYISSIPHHVEMYDLRKKNRYSFLKIVIQIAYLFRKLKPDVVLSFMDYTNLVAILAKLLSSRKFTLIISIHTHLRSALFHVRYRLLKVFLYKKFFNYANLVIVPSFGIMYDLVEGFNVSREKIKVIYNPINIVNITRSRDESLDKHGMNLGKYILGVGRLKKPKGYPYLLKAYSLISKSIDERLVILGEGEEEYNLKKLAKDLRIQERVLFLGFQRNPYKFMRNATVFVLSSLWESFALVIVEAMTCGVPVISTDCPSGPGEIITNGENGILVPPKDEQALADAILNLLKDENLRKRLAEEGRKRAEDFRIEKILPRYEELFN